MHKDLIKKTWPLLGLVMLLWCGFASSTVWAGPAVSLKPRPLTSEAYGESYTVVGDFENGAYVLLQLLFSNAGLGDQKAACRLTLVPAQGKATNESARMDRDEWTYLNTENRIVAKHCQLHAKKEQTTFAVDLPEIRAEVHLHRTARVTQPPGHELKTNDGFYRAQVLVPWSDATLKLTPKTGATEEIKGRAYLDRTLSNVLLPDIADGWYRFRGFDKKAPFLAEIRFPPQKGPPLGWIWTSDGSMPVAIDGPISVNGTSQSVELKFTNGGKSFSIRSRKKIYEYEPVKAHGIMGRLAKPWIGDPKVTTFRAEVTGASAKKVRGILERAIINP